MFGETLDIVFFLKLIIFFYDPFLSDRKVRLNTAWILMKRF